MTSIFKDLKFKFSWRSYQQHFLAGFQEHIRDEHLHVIAPPGSGKTILGLEMLIRIDKPTLVLAPTLTIRNQWKSRLLEFFTTNAKFEALSLNIKKPSFITFSTYQSLFALSKSFTENSKQALLEFIKANKIETLVLDEAHHLKNEWWKCLFHLKEIEGLTIISLTATPPYDSSALELNRYFDLCGPIDEEIGVPDLIKNGDLCPHQDYVYFSKPDDAQIKYIVEYREEILKFTNQLVANIQFQEFLCSLDFYKNPEEFLDYIYQHPTFFSSILIYLKSAGHAIDKKCLKILGFSSDDISFPSFTYEWSQALLQYVLVNERLRFVNFEEVLNPIEKELKQIGVLDKKRVNFIGDEFLYRNLANSSSKLESIYSICKNTKQGLGDSARIVILADFIRKEFLDFTGIDTKTLNKLGVVPIFKYLLAKNTQEISLGVLTGSLVMLHKEALAELKADLAIDKIGVKPLEGSKDYYVLNVSGNLKNKIASAVTRLFEEGVIKTLIGTKSYLGEGWDAPCINSLILASYVGSFVSSNQMRGRAIRVYGKDPDKTAAVWHLACLDPTATDGGKDIEKLEQRFDAFTGVSLVGKPYIENGIDRLVLPMEWSHETSIASINDAMLSKSLEKEDTKDRWKTAIEKGSILVRELKVPFKSERPFAKTKRLNALNAAKFVSIQLITGITFFIPEFLVKNFGAILSKGFLQLLYWFLGALILGFGPKTFKALKLYFLFGNQYKKTKKIAKALLAYLIRTKLVNTELNFSFLHAEQDSKGTFSIYLKGASQQDSNLFISYLEEIVAPVENPRYLLVSHNWFKRKLGIRSYYVVPRDIGKNKVQAELFQKYWNKEVDGSRILFTRSLEGRKQLLKARFSHLRYQFEEVSKKTVTWK